MRAATGGGGTVNERAWQGARAPGAREDLVIRYDEEDLIARFEDALRVALHALAVDECAVDGGVEEREARAGGCCHNGKHRVYARDAVVRREGLLAVRVAAEAEALARAEL